ncbi:MAG: hypothetical protein V7K92_12880 [Nostoc sp.]
MVNSLLQIITSLWKNALIGLGLTLYDSWPPSLRDAARWRLLFETLRVGGSLRQATTCLR